MQDSGMSQPLRVLHLEDNHDYSALVSSKLAAEGLAAEVKCVDTREDFQAALDKGGYDLIIADFSLPDYDGISAMKLAQQKQPEIPILLVSGTIGEEAAIESLKAGAMDYVLKQWPERLVPAVRRALREAGERQSRLRAESALARRESRFRALSENALDVVSVLDQQGNFTYNSPSVERVLGYKPEELQGQNAFALIHEEDLSAAQEEFRQTVEFPGMTRTAKFRVRHRDGTWRHFETICKSMLNEPEIAGVVVNSRDVSERHRLEEQLWHSQKMEAIGQLAGGVAHDFNNILTVIQGHASMLRTASLSSPSSSSVDQIYLAAERAAGLTRQLLTFSRRQMMQPKILDLNGVVSNMTKMMGRLLGEDIALQFSYAPGQPSVRADEGMLQQILLNLAVNSRDAMPAGGKLGVEISVRELGEADMGKHPERRAGRYVRLSVSDTGSGIPADILPRIFEPFFTTKAVGKGTGLGLATVYGIVKQHQGWIEVESQVGQGTTFHIFLPASREAGLKPDETTTIIEALPGGTETILLVEDEQPVRDLVRGVLAGRGYRVLEAASGVQALEVWRRHKDEIDLLFTDIVMPDGMTGRDLAEKVQAEKPGLKAIFTSGYSAEIIGKDFILQEGLNYLQKPFLPHKLAHAIRKCLDGK